MKTSAVARRYARALFALAREEHRESEVGAELERISAVLAESAELREALFTPLHPVEERKKVLESIASSLELSVVVRHFQAFLIDQRRIVDFPAICEEFARLADEMSGLVTAEVTAASPLDDRRKDRLRRARVSRRSNRDFICLMRSLSPATIASSIRAERTISAIISGRLVSPSRVSRRVSSSIVGFSPISWSLSFTCQANSARTG